MELYNTTIDGKSPLFTYTPFRAAGVEGALGAWTLANPDLVRGTSYTTNHTGANVGLQWTGTSIWLYGSTRARSNYQIIRSWSDKVIYGNGTNGTDGVLFSESDLNYGSYTVALSVIEGSVTVSRATITVGMGVPGTALQSQNQSAAAGGGQVNPYFRTSANSSWAPFILEGSQSVLRTTGFGDRITFTVQSSVGFAIYGTTAFESGAYNISVVPPPDNLPSIVQYNASTAFEVLDALKFLATGLNETMDYTCCASVELSDQCKFDVKREAV
ncbi:hypothetical protein EVJ58_g5931 [Rhodofomes roseus]|uniref:Uncharacterized protein n=1 Tax=Rhodofomes roseus TaxID=34475 RepID=A0A4Y9YCL6_9APHY|nr:hypothetical protein EVJ58_g5931 [Rhodofomes roseus]